MTHCLYIILMHHIFSTMSDVSNIIESNNTEVLSGKQSYLESSIKRFLLEMCCLALFFMCRNIRAMIKISTKDFIEAIVTWLIFSKTKIVLSIIRNEEVESYFQMHSNNPRLSGKLIFLIIFKLSSSEKIF